MNDLKKLSNPDIAEYLGQYNSALVAARPDLDRIARNTMFYTGLDQGQYTQQELALLRDEDRDAQAYNIVQYYVNGYAGSMATNWNDPKFVDNDADNRDTALATNQLQRLYYADKNKFSYKDSGLQVILDGTINRGVEELVIDRTFDPRGRIRFNPVRPSSIIFDPTVTDDCIHRNARKAWREVYMSIEDMKTFYQDSSDAVDAAYLKQMQPEDGAQYEYQEVAVTEQNKKLKIHNQYLCVMCYEIKMERHPVTIDISTGKELPETPYPLGSQEDFLIKQQWAQANGFDLQMINMRPFRNRIKPVLYVTTICPQLAITLQQPTKDERQLDGKLPFYMWSFMSKGGKTVGIADIAIAVQRDFNANELRKGKFLDNMPLGKMWVNEGIFEGNQDAKDEFVRDFNDISKPAKVPDGVPYGVTPFGFVPGAQIPSHIFNDQSAKLRLFDLICHLPPVVQGSSKSGDSGVLFGRKVVEANIANQIPIKNLEAMTLHKAMDWKKMAITVYGGRSDQEKIANINRKFSDPNGTQFTMNQVEGVNPDGSIVYINSISELDSGDIIIAQSKDNDYAKQAKREESIAALQAMQPSQTNDGMRAAIEVQFVRNLDTVDESDKKEIDAMCKSRIEIAKANDALTLASLQAKTKQFNAPPSPPVEQPHQSISVTAAFKDLPPDAQTAFLTKEGYLPQGQTPGQPGQPMQSPGQQAPNSPPQGA